MFAFFFKRNHTFDTEKQAVPFKGTGCFINVEG